MKTLRYVKSYIASCFSMIFLSLALIAAPAAVCQGVTGNISGTVTDPAGAVVVGATVTAQNTSIGVETTTVTNSAGAYNLRFLAVGEYTITVIAQGFAKFEPPPFVLEVDHTAKIDVILSLGTANETVKVDVEVAPLLNTTDASLGVTLTNRQIQAIPLNGLNFSSVTLFQPGAVNTDPSGLTGNNAIERTTFNNGINSVNGNRNQANNYTLDGVDLNEGQNNLIAYNPAPEAIEQIKVISANAAAEYGNVNGGDVLTVLRSGTNSYHGSAYAYLENQTLNANTWSNNFNGVPRNPFTQTIFGGSVGGPIRHNKLFFFADYEGVRRHTSGSAIASVLPAAMRTGDFSALLNPPTGQPVQLYDTQNNFMPYVNNQVPVVNPVAKFLFSHPELYPLPNATPTDGLLQNNFHGPNRQFIVNNQGDIKVDWEPRAADSVSGFYSQSNAYDGNIVPLAISFPSQNLYPSKVLGLRWVHVFSPSLVNEARVGFTRVRWDNGIPTDTTGIFGLTGNSQVLGIPFGTQQYPGFAFQGVSGGGLNGSASNSNGITGFGTSANTQIIRDNTFSYGDNLSWSRGKHLMTFGVQAIRYQQNYFNNGNFGPLGNFFYGGEFTGLADGTLGYAPADFVLDRVDHRNIGVPGGLVGNRQWRSAGFAQDDWKIFPKLTLNLGLRYEFDQPWYEVHDKTANVIPDNGGTVIYAGPVPASAPPGSERCDNRACYEPNYKQFMPRIGFAWQAKPRLVLRGGYGATSFFEGNAANQRLTSSPPFVQISDQFAVKPSTTTGGGTPFTVEEGFGGATGLGGNGFGAWPQHIQPAYIQEFSLTTEYAFTNQTALSVGYVGERGQHLMDYRNGNQLTAPGAPPPYPNIANLSNQATALLITESAAMMNYNAGQVTLRHHTGHGLEFVVNYTYAKALTNSSGNYGTPNINGSDGAFQNGYDSRADIGPAGQDVRHNLSALGVYALPFGRGKQFGTNVKRWADEIIGGWSLSGSLVAYSGFPITVNGPSAINTNSYGQPRANHYRQLKIVNQTVSNWWGTDPSALPCLGADNGVCAYGVATSNTYGTSGVNTERAPGYRQVDASFFKDFHITESQAIGFRVDFFNAFNIASYGNPDNNVTDTTFGQITNTRSPARQIQFSLHYRF
jgi:hypothetical protein